MKAIAAMNDERIIGYQNQLPWHIPEDLTFFKQTTLGHTIVMGRKTFESIGSKALPKRLNIVISKTLLKQDVPENVIVLNTLEDLKQTNTQGDIFIIGGQSLYQSALKDCTDLYITHVKGHFKGDTFFPDFENDFHPIATLATHDAFKIVHYQRKNHFLNKNL
jgi:dihydrofolate reductase